MENIKFNANNIEPIYIFEYYDTPLIFISNKINEKYYFFYFIDDNKYFIKPLSTKDINSIFSSQCIKDFLDLFLESIEFKIIEFITNDEASLYSVSEFEEIIGENIESCFPDKDVEFEYEYVNRISFSELKGVYKSAFPELFNHKHLTIKLKDAHNSYSANPSTVLKAIEWIGTYISEKKAFLNASSIFPNEKLQLLPFSPGSFNINFELFLPREVSIFEDNELDFDDFVAFIDSLDSDSAEVMYEEFLYESPKIVKATNEFYKDMKDLNLEIEILDKEHKLAAVVASAKLDEKMDQLHSLSKAKEFGREEREILPFKGEVRSATKIRNTISIGLAGESVSARFTKELFREIKESTKSVAVSREITGQWERISILDENNVEISVKYVIISFEQ